MKIVCMGTNAFVVPMFERIAQNHDVVAVYTRAPKPVGRKKIVTKSPVHIWAESRGIPVYHNVREYDMSPDMVVIVSYGVLLRDNVLNSAPCINIHPSDLPKYRGPSPIRTAIYNGDTESAVCLMAVAPELDAGDVYMRCPFKIESDDTNETIENKVSEIGAQMLSEYISNPSKYPARPQVGEPTYSRKFIGTDEMIDWARTPSEIHNQVRALGCGRTKINGLDVKILETRVVNDKLEILRLQPAGKNPMIWRDFINGQHTKVVKFGE